jgi:alkylation response protein AidB-like acyl-CoA dehydrogenase
MRQLVARRFRAVRNVARAASKPMRYQAALHLAHHRPVDAQVPGDFDLTDDTIVARIFREARPFRICDGTSEVHRWSIVQRVLRGRMLRER